MKMSVNETYLHFERVNADEYRLWHGHGQEAIYCGSVGYTPVYGWDAYSFLDHSYLSKGPFGENDEGLEKAQKALIQKVNRRGTLEDSWLEPEKTGDSSAS